MINTSNYATSQKGLLGAILVASITLICAAMWFVARPNTCEYVYGNRYAMTADKNASRFGYLAVGTPESVYGYDIKFSIVLRDGTLVDLANPDINMLISKCGEGETAISGGRSGARWPAGAVAYQNSPQREFIVREGRLLAFTIMIEKSSGERIELEDHAGIRHPLPLSRDEMLDVLGRGGAFRLFHRQ